MQVIAEIQSLLYILINIYIYIYVYKGVLQYKEREDKYSGISVKYSLTMG